MAISSNPKRALPQPDRRELQRALGTLTSYGPGSSRGELQPIDEAVIVSLPSPADRKELEGQLLKALAVSNSVEARDYVCTKLALIGTAASVPALAALLDTEPLSTAARNVLESMPGPEAAQALRVALEKVNGLQKIGLINSLGARRDAASLRILTRLSKDADSGIAAAAIAAIGEIGSPRAARILRATQTQAPAQIRKTLTDASLVCAERLLAAGHKRAATTLYESLHRPGQPQHIHQAIDRGRRSAA